MQWKRGRLAGAAPSSSKSLQHVILPHCNLLLSSPLDEKTGLLPLHAVRACGDVVVCHVSCLYRTLKLLLGINWAR
eukprot:6447505-Amphidinium_carterae.1